MQQELLFEIGTEEIPAGYLMPALDDIKRLLAQKLDDLFLSYDAIKTAGTPRRLVACVTGLDACQEDRREKVMGPPKKAAFDAENRPTKAAVGFAKSKGASLDDIEIVTTEKGEYLMLVLDQKGEETEKLLADVLPEVLKEIPFPKSMRWGAGPTVFARPIQWIVALYGGKVIPVQANDVVSGNTTMGHRFMANTSFPVDNYSDYISKLRDAHVLVDPDERRRAVMTSATEAAQKTGGQILSDDELSETVTHLVETPYPVCGTFEDRFLDLPRDVLITSMREHQKYFAVTDDNGTLLPHFIAVNNTRVNDEKVAAQGHQRVIRARLEDALFFFKEDRNKTLAERVDDLSGIIFQNKLGTLLEKTHRVTELAALLAEQHAPDTIETTKRAAHLSKADLLTDMVNEFPSLQGVMGRDYALQNNEGEDVARAILEHYMPVRAGGELPPSIPGALVSMADRIDTIAGCFGIGQTPSGTTDPFGLRRLTLGLLHIIKDKNFHVNLRELVKKALGLYGDKLTEDRATAEENIIAFIKGRFVNDLTAKGIPAEAVLAVTSVSFDDIVECSQRVNALVELSGKPSFALLAGAFKRVMNIIKDHDGASVNESLLTEPAEQKLFATFSDVQARVLPLVNEKKYTQAMEIILEMKEPVDAFFDDVMVMTDDQDIRRNRLSLLKAIADLFLEIGDFSKMHTA